MIVPPEGDREEDARAARFRQWADLTDAVALAAKRDAAYRRLEAELRAGRISERPPTPS